MPYLQSNSSSTTGTSLNVIYPSAVQKGSFLVANVILGQNAVGSLGISDSQGNTWTLAGSFEDSTTSHAVYIYYCPNAASGVTGVTITLLVSTPIFLTIGEYAGISTTTTVAFSGNSAGSGTSLSAGNVTVPSGGSVIAFAFNASGGSIAAGTNFTSRRNSGGQFLEDWLYTGTSPVNATATSSTAVWNMSAIAVQTAAFVYGDPTLTSPVLSERAVLTAPIFLNPAYETPIIQSLTMADGTVGTAYSQTLNVVNGTSPFTFSVLSGSLPTGLSLNASTGTISGTPSSAATYTFGIKVVDVNSNSSSVVITLKINAATAASGGSFTFIG